MELDSLFRIAFQGSLVLGLVHGVTPCGHSWLMLSPLVVGQKHGRKVAFLTVVFIAGTAIACPLLPARLPPPVSPFPVFCSPYFFYFSAFR